MIKKYHYTHSFSSCRYALGIFYQKDTQHKFFDDVDEELIGCMSYGYPVGRSVVGSIFSDDKMLTTKNILELTRLFIHDGYGKNIESYSISQSFKWLKKNAKDIKFEYRKNNIPDDYIFLSASFKGTKSNQKKIEEVINKFKFEKEKNQPTRVKTSGSTFKNPILQTDKKVWQLIKESVPLNQSFGDACISEKHCNFFVNKGNAKFQDMKKLIDHVYEKVLKKTGISLEKEIKILE